MTDQKLRDDMNYLKGQIAALQFPMVHDNQGYYDLLESILNQYESIMDRIIE